MPKLCKLCSRHGELLSPSDLILTSASRYFDGSTTYGGFSNEMVCNEHFAVRFPDNLPLDAGAPLLCAGVTVYSPMKYYGFAKPGNHVGINGFGGLGHVAVKCAKAMGAKVTVISRSSKKKEEAIDYLGADEFLVSQNPEEMKAAMGTMDGIIDCVSAKHQLLPLLGLLKSHGKIVLVGVPVEPLELPAAAVVMEGRVWVEVMLVD